MKFFIYHADTGWFIWVHISVCIASWGHECWHTCTYCNKLIFFICYLYGRPEVILYKLARTTLFGRMHLLLGYANHCLCAFRVLFLNLCSHSPGRRLMETMGHHHHHLSLLHSSSNWQYSRTVICRAELRLFKMWNQQSMSWATYLHS